MKRLTKTQRADLEWWASKAEGQRDKAAASVVCVAALAVIDSQAAEIRDLKKRLKAAKTASDSIYCDHAFSSGDEQRTMCDRCTALDDALDLRKPFEPEGGT